MIIGDIFGNSMHMRHKREPRRWDKVGDEGKYKFEEKTQIMFKKDTPATPVFKKEALIHDKEQGCYLFELDVPGFNADSLSIYVGNRNLMEISGKVGRRVVNTTIVVPTEVDVDSIMATVINGVLTITAHAREEERVKTRKIRIQSG